MHECPGTPGHANRVMMDSKIVLAKYDRKTLLGIPFPIQSLRQLIGSVAAIALGIGIVVFVVKVFFHAKSLHGIFSGALIGSVPLLFALLPSQLVIKYAPEGHAYWNTAVLNWIDYFGYHCKTIRNGRAYYHTRQRKFFRWQENEIFIENGVVDSENVIIVVGPAAILRLMKKKLEAR